MIIEKQNHGLNCFYYKVDDFILIFISPTCNNSDINFRVFWDIKGSGRNGNQLDLDNLLAKLV